MPNFCPQHGFMEAVVRLEKSFMEMLPEKDPAPNNANMFFIAVQNSFV